MSGDRANPVDESAGTKGGSATLRHECSAVEDATARTTSSTIELREIESLKRHPALEKLGIDPLAQRTPEYDAIGVRRLIRPIQITPDGSIIEGEDRVEAAKAQGMTKVSCEIYYVSKGDSLILLLRECRELRGLGQACRIELALQLETGLSYSSGLRNCHFDPPIANRGGSLAFSLQ